MPSDPSSQPTQPLADLHAIGAVADAFASGRNPMNLCLRMDSLASRVADLLVKERAEVDRLRAELDSMTRFAEDLREERDRRLRSEGERGAERDALAAKIEATAELHPAWFCETCNSPGPCLTRIRLGLDQGGRGQDA